MTRSLHPKKEVEAALRHAETHGWRVTVGGAHAWGKIYCPRRHDECRCGEFCITSVWSTPRNPGNHARALRRVVDTAHGGRRAARRGTAMEYIFTLKYQLGSDVEDMDAVIERLGEAGCDDALAGIGLPGRLALEFTREAPSAEVAVGSALDDVRRALPDARLIEAAPDLVGLTDVAEIAGVSRQAMRKLMLAYPGSFRCRCMKAPRPWHLADLLEWLRARGNAAWPPALAEVARAALQVNLARKGAGPPPEAPFRARRATAVPGRRARHRARG